MGTNFVQELVWLLRTTFKEAYQDIHTPENLHAYCETNYTLDAAREILTDPESVCRVAFRDRQPAGFYVVKHHECPIPLRGGSSELKQIYVVAAEYGLSYPGAYYTGFRSCADDIIGGVDLGGYMSIYQSWDTPQHAVDPDPGTSGIGLGWLQLYVYQPTRVDFIPSQNGVIEVTDTDFKVNTVRATHPGLLCGAAPGPDDLPPCELPTAVETSTWGKLKTLYR